MQILAQNNFTFFFSDISFPTHLDANISSASDENLYHGNILNEISQILRMTGVSLYFVIKYG